MLKLLYTLLLLWAPFSAFGDAIISAETMAWTDLQHPITNDFQKAGIQFREFKYNYMTGQYSLDLQGTLFTNLNALCGILKQHDFTRPPHLPEFPPSIWGPIYKGPCSLNLGLYGTSVTNISMLSGIPIKSIDIRNTRIRDVSPLADLPLSSLWFDPFPGMHGIETLKTMKSLKKVNGRPPVEYWRWLDRIFNKENTK